MSKVIKGIGKAVKGIVKGVKKVFKKITSSKLGKALLIGATIYLGGAALGMWQSPFQSINGALTAGGKASAGGSMAATGETAAMTAAETATAGAGNIAGTGAGSIGANVATNVNPALVSAGAPATIGTGASPAAAAATAGPVGAQSTSAGSQALEAGGAGAGSASPGISAGEYVKAMETGVPGAGTAAGAGEGSVITRLLDGTKKAFTKTSGFVQDHPYASAMMLNAAAGALSPDQMDMLQAEYDRQDEERERRERNMQVAGIDLGVRPNRDRTLRTTDGAPVYRGGFLNTGMLRGQ